MKIPITILLTTSLRQKWNHGAPDKLHKNFSKRVYKVYGYLQVYWSNWEAEQFLQILDRQVTAIQTNAAIGSAGAIKNVRGVSVTYHNRLFYKIYPDKIGVLYLEHTCKRRCWR